MNNKVQSKDAESRQQPASFGKPWWIIISSAAIFLGSQVIAGLLVGLLLAFGNQGSVDIAQLFDESAPVQFLYVLLAEGLSVALVLRILRHRGLKPAAIGLGRWPNISDVKFATLGILTFYGLAIAGSIILSLFMPESELNKEQNIGFNNLVTSFDKALAFISLVVLPPLGEEILMRGYLYSGLRTVWRFWPALIVTSLLFGLAHLDSGQGGGLVWAAAFNTFVLSGVLVYVRQYSGALFAGILIHAFNNLIAFSIHFR